MLITILFSMGEGGGCSLLKELEFEEEKKTFYNWSQSNIRLNYCH